jgi:basic amino acid/polyamine antiporter, APA family
MNPTKPTRRPSPQEREDIEAQRKPKRALGLFDSTMVVIGVMIGSGIFIVPADMARLLGGPGWLLAAWVFAAVLTIAAAFSFGELASMMPGGGGMYLYLREAYSPLWGFLYGWTLFTVIQTGTIAAVAVAFARFLGVLAPSISESRYLVAPVHLSAPYAITLSTAQLVALMVILLLTATNTLGIEYGKIIQNSFTVAKLGAMGALILLGLTVGWNASTVHANLAAFWQRPAAATAHPASSFAALMSLLMVFCVSQSGSLFSADSWHDITFAAEEVKDPRTTLPRALAIGVVIVMLIYLAANVAYMAVLNFSEIQHAPHDRVATAMLQHIFPAWGGKALAVLIMVSTFGCINSLVLAGPRAYYAMARDRLFVPAAGRLNRARVPGWSLAMQGVWAAVLVLLTTYSPATGYGNLYSDLLDYIISAALLFYILTIAAVVVLRSKRPDAERLYRTPGYPVVPAVYILGASAVVLCLFIDRPATTWPGLVLVISGLPVYWLIRRAAPSKPGDL